MVKHLTNARQENLLIGTLYTFSAPDVPVTVLADNMRNVVIRRDAGRDSPREQQRFERAG